MIAAVWFVVLSAPCLWLVHWLMSLGGPYDEPVFWGTFTLGCIIGFVPSRIRTFALCWLIAMAIAICLVPWLKLLEKPFDELYVGGALAFGSLTGKGMSCWSRRCSKCRRFNAMSREGNSLLNLLHDVIPPRPTRVRFNCRYCSYEEWQDLSEES